MLFAHVMSTASVAVAEQPMSLREHIAAEEPASPVAPVVAPVATPAAVPAVETPVVPEAAEVEANSLKPDAELSEAGRTLRANRADKRAERIRHDNDELARELHRRQTLRSELERVAPAPAATAAATPAAGTTVDPSDPRPAYDVEKYGKTFPEDPYAGYLLDLNRWDRRQEAREQAATRQRQQGQQATRASAERLAQQMGTGRTKFSDYDAVIDPVISALAAGHPQRDVDFTNFILASDVGGEIVYRLGKDSAALQAVLHAKTGVDLARALVAVESGLTGSPRAASAEPAPVTQATPVPSATVGGAAAAAEPDTRAGVPLKDHIRIEEAEIADRRKRGYRY